MVHVIPVQMVSRDPRSPARAGGTQTGGETDEHQETTRRLRDSHLLALLLPL